MTRRNYIDVTCTGADALEGEYLEDILEVNRERIKAVCLVYAWEINYFCWHPAIGDADVFQTVFDDEYCCVTDDLAEAMKFAANYGCWDSKTVYLTKEGILVGYNVEWDSQYSENDGYHYDYKGGAPVEEVERIYLNAVDKEKGPVCYAIDMRELRNECMETPEEDIWGDDE